jgi:hypothetical protein
VTQREIITLNKRLAVANKRAVDAEVRLFRQEEETGAVRMQYDRLQDALGRLYDVGHAIEPSTLNGAANSEFVRLVSSVKDLRELSAALAAAKPFLKPRGRNAKTPTQ